MAKDDFFGTTLDGIYRSKHLRVPSYAVFIYNRNRTRIGDLVLHQENGPRYDISHWVVNLNYVENIIFENNEDSVATNVSIELRRDPNALPIEITERTLLDDTPIQIFSGDLRVPIDDWVPIFTGVLRGNPQVAEEIRTENANLTIICQAVERAEAFLKTVITAKSYDQGQDIGKVVTETAIEFMGIDRQEVRIGEQNYAVGHPQSQIVDIEVMNGIAQVLFTVGKKPKFDSLGFLTAADTDLEKAPARTHITKDLIISIIREQILDSVNNSVRLRGLSNELTQVVEREKRLAHVDITSGFFESSVKTRVDFSETQGKDQGGRRAKNTRITNIDKSTLGDTFSQTVGWNPFIEADGETVFAGEVIFDTGFAPELVITLTTVWFIIRTVDLLVTENDHSAGLITAAAGAAASPISGSAVSAGLLTAAAGNEASVGLNILADGILLGIFLSMMELGRVNADIVGQPFQNVYQELVATGQLINLLTQEIREVEFRNDWLYDIDVIQARARELLKRELVKGWTYVIEMLDDPLLEVDDILEIVDRKYYITSIKKRMTREAAPPATMSVTAWRIT